MRTDAFFVVLDFQLRTGVRVALRYLAPLAAAVTAAAVMLGSVLAVLVPVRAVFLSRALPFESSLATSLMCYAVAAASAPRLRGGLRGWARHLPVSARTNRRAAVVGLAVAEIPVLLLLLAAGLTVLKSPTWNVQPRLLGLPIVALGTAAAALGECRSRARVLAMLAAVMAGCGWWLLLAASPLVLVLADAAAGPLPTTRSLRRKWARGRTSAPTQWMWLQLSRRALGGKVLAAWVWLPATFLPAVFFIKNNEVAPVYESGAVRLAGLSAAVLVITTVVDLLAKRRPPWPWARSLPWSAGARVVMDAVLLAATALPAVVLAGLVRPETLLPLAATVPLFAVRGAATVRQEPGAAGAAAGQFVAEGLVVACLITLVPWSAVLAIAAVPAAFLHAAGVEKRHAVGRWYELQHLAAGDSMSWSDS